MVFTAGNKLESSRASSEATRACLKALQDPWVRCGDRLGIQRRALRLARKVKSWGTLGARWRSDILWEAPIDSIRARALNGSVREKKRYCTISEVGDATVSVEELAIMHYAEEDAGSWRGVHSESRAWMTLFGLLFADVILSPVPGVFHGPFQSAPLDLCTDSFVEARRDDITKLLFEIRRGKGTKIIRDVWRRYYGTAIYGVSWVLLSLDELCDIILSGLAMWLWLKLWVSCGGYFRVDRRSSLIFYCGGNLHVNQKSKL